MDNKFKFAVYCDAQGLWDEDEFIEEFNSLKEAKQEAIGQAGSEVGEKFYILKYRKIFEVGEKHID